MDKPVITFCSDENYIHHASTLVNSILAHNTNVDIYARLVNVDEDNPLKGKCNIYHDNRELNLKREYFKDRPDHLFIDYEYSFWHKRKGQIRPNITYSEQAAYTCHKRFDNIVKLIQDGYKSILAIDVDSVVRKDITSLLSSISSHDVAAIGRVVRPGDIAYYENGDVVTPSEERIGFYEEGILGSSNSDSAYEFWVEVADQINMELTDWNADCRILYKIFDKYRDILNLYQIPRTYKNKLLEEDAHIWSGDCIRKKTSRYKDEQSKYED